MKQLQNLINNLKHYTNIERTLEALSFNETYLIIASHFTDEMLINALYGGYSKSDIDMLTKSIENDIVIFNDDDKSMISNDIYYRG